MRLFDDFRVDGMAMPIPDRDVELNVSDLDDSDSGRDESGVMHRIVARYGVRSWAFSYSLLTMEEYRYLQALFQGKSRFVFTFRDAAGREQSCWAYCSSHRAVLGDLKLGLVKSVKLSIIEC